MNVTEPQDGDRGQVGIGTLIIFIAMVLVAAVAAGVLINTAGMLEAKASDTSTDAQSQVSNHIVAVSATGEVNADGTGVNRVNLTLMQAAGAGDIDLSKASFEWVSDSAAVTLSHDDSAVSLINMSGDSNTTLNDRSDRIRVSINVTSPQVEGTHLAEGEEAMLQIVDQSGAKTLYGVNVPQSISDEEYVVV
ncbi:archaellin/type IV pilin N-terminal domain-containing protein [Haloarchaeobius iranensis]|uniref:Flagellin n=1 Tax=Haloarchaeobius iranensis TaxID=996166 RepID=A0A1G9ZH42_9EURY|nr:archaellin/type IV pilin N-terminal domain-containing protein [Haloarchaeobius iranensis]SDN20397.1 flagellin FlaA/flagellin FlaB [Haloarchaeobius iranensis]